MQLISGTTVLLNGEPVDNVLIGEPSLVLAPFGAGHIPAYTLGIPKGDAHSWTDARLSFFGREFRSVGYPEEGIEANIPTPWHKRVRAEQLCITGACTIWERGSFAPHVCERIFLRDLRGSRTDKTGEVGAGELQLYLYGILLPDGCRPRSGDLVAPGESDFTFDTASEQTLSESMRAFRAAYPGHAVIREVRPILNAGTVDYEVTAR